MCSNREDDGIQGPVVTRRSKTEGPPKGDTPGEDSLSWSPPVDIFETDDRYVLIAELPGVESGDIWIEVADSDVSIQGERRHVCSGEGFHRLEGFRGRFHRTFSLPELLHDAEVTTALEDGVLRVELAKSARSPEMPARPQPR